jgi:transposase
MRELAESFGVSLGWVEKISRQRRQSGQMERVEQRHGPAGRVTGKIEASLRGQVRRTPDRTLLEWQRFLREAHGVELGLTQIWRVLRRMELRLKKSRFTRKSKIPKKAVGVANNGGKQSRRWKRTS